MESQVPHGVEQRSILHDPQEFVGHGHVVGHRFLAIMKECVRGPNLTGHQIVERKGVHWSMKLQPFVQPALTEEDVHCVFLKEGQRQLGFTEVQYSKQPTKEDLRS